MPQASHPSHPGRVTIVGIARAADVSRQTVSNVVNRPERVHEATRRRVQAQIDRLGYRPSVAAQSLRARRAGAVGVELHADADPEVRHPFLVELCRAGPEHGYHVVPFAARHDGPRVDGYRRLIGSHVVDAFILSGVSATDPRPALLQEHGVPFVVQGRPRHDPSCTAWVDVDDAAGAEAATVHLAERGYSPVAFLGPAGAAPNRRRGWERAVARLGLPGAGLARSGEPDARAALRAGRELVAALGPGGAVVCDGDAATFAVLRAGWETGLTPGRRLGVVGLEDSTCARTHGVSTVAPPWDCLAGELLGMVRLRLDTGVPPSHGVRLRPSVVARTSSNPLPDAGPNPRTGEGE